MVTLKNWASALLLSPMLFQSLRKTKSEPSETNSWTGQMRRRVLEGISLSMAQCAKEIKLRPRTVRSWSSFGPIPKNLKMTINVNFQSTNKPWANNFSVMIQSMNSFTVSTGTSKILFWRWRAATTTLWKKWVNSSVMSIERSKHTYLTRLEAMSTSDVRKYSSSTCTNSVKLGSTYKWRTPNWQRSINKTCAMKSRKYWWTLHKKFTNFLSCISIWWRWNVINQGTWASRFMICSTS